MPGSEFAIWDTAGSFDTALQAKASLLRLLQSKRIRAVTASRDAMFSAIARGNPTILRNVQVPVEGSGQHALTFVLSRAIARAFRSKGVVRTQVGPSRLDRRISVEELLRRWQSGRSYVSVTDLHIRGTRLESEIDTDELTRFNLFPLGSDDMRRQEMLTLVVSSRGNVTDSHSDDPDGSNHCFVGRKLWLAWDTLEGRKAGLQDCSLDRISDRAAFDLATFCRLGSSKWWLVEPGDTLFLPGKFTHRVVTIDPYIGIGSFYFAPASCLANLSRWYSRGANWALEHPRGQNDELVDELAVSMAGKVRRLARQSNHAQERWGLDYASMSLRAWRRQWTGAQRQRLLAIPAFAKVCEALSQSARHDETHAAPRLVRSSKSRSAQRTLHDV